MLQEMNEIILMILTGGFAAFLIYVGYGNYRKRKACCIPVRGIFVEVRTIKRRNTIYKYGVFEYNYQGQSYRHSSIDNIAGRRGQNFHIGEAYEIYINPQKPKSLRCLKKLWILNDIAAFLAGIYFGGLILLGILGKIFLGANLL